MGKVEQPERAEQMESIFVFKKVKLLLCSSVVSVSRGGFRRWLIVENNCLEIPRAAFDDI